MTVKRSFSLPDEVSAELDAQAGGNASAYVAAVVRERLTRDRDVHRLAEVFGEPDPSALAYWRHRLVVNMGPAGPAERTAPGTHTNVSSPSSRAS